MRGGTKAMRVSLARVKVAGIAGVWAGRRAIQDPADRGLTAPSDHQINPLKGIIV